MSELISAIIPTYNRAQFLARALRSVAAQDYRPIEAIVIDESDMDRLGIKKIGDTENSSDEVGILDLLFKDREACRKECIEHGRHLVSALVARILNHLPSPRFVVRHPFDRDHLLRPKQPA